MQLKEISIENIKPNPLQPREHFDKEKLKELAESILSNGLINPITVREVSKGQYEIVAGERRWKAHQIANQKKIISIVKKYKSEGQVAIESLIENLHRDDLSTVEKARHAKRIMEEEGIKSIRKLAERIKIKQRAVNYWFEEAGIREELEPSANIVSSSIIKETAGLEREQRLKLIEKAAKKDYDVKDVRLEKEAIKLKETLPIPKKKDKEELKIIKAEGIVKDIRNVAVDAIEDLERLYDWINRDYSWWDTKSKKDVKCICRSVIQSTNKIERRSDKI